MRHLGVLLMIGIVCTWAGDASASVPLTPGQVSGAPTESPAAPLLAKKKKKKKTPPKKKDPPAVEPKAAEGTPAAGTTTPAEGDPKPAGGTGDWGSSDWASPGWAGDKGSDSSGKLLGSEKSTSDTPVEAVETSDSKPRTKYKRVDGIAGAALILRPSYTGAGRMYSYDKAATPNLRPYRANFVSMVGGELELYPGVWAGMNGLDLIGLCGSYKQALGLKSSPRANRDLEYTTTWNTWDVGARGRLAFGDALLALDLRFGTMKFDLSVPSGDALAGQVQNLNYSYLRAGLDFRYAIGQLAIMLGGAYRQVFGTGPLKEDYFPDSSALGFDAHAGASFQLLEVLEVYAQGNYLQFMHSFDTGAGDTYIADGASDTYFGGELGIAVFF